MTNLKDNAAAPPRTTVRIPTTSGDERRERQLDGIAMAKRQGVYKGGKARLDRARVKNLLDSGMGPAAIARELGMARSSVYRLLEEVGQHRV
jgi:DNA invertase Pin-like site-specific DNA recombinase